MDAVFALVVALEAIPIGLVTFADHPARGRNGSGLLGRGSVRGFNCCDTCGAGLPVSSDVPWRLSGTCRRCGAAQSWATPAVGIAPAPVEPWTRIERPDPSRRRFTTPRTLPVRTTLGTPQPSVPAANEPGPAPGPVTRPRTPTRRIAASAPAPPAPPRVRPVRPERDLAASDPFLLEPAAQAGERVAAPRVLSPEVHRPLPARRGFRRENGMPRVSAVLGQKGFNCCEACGVTLPREPDREWRYAGTCPRCGQVQIWAS